jgi:hypothetical protein
MRYRWTGLVYRVFQHCIKYGPRGRYVTSRELFLNRYPCQMGYSYPWKVYPRAFQRNRPFWPVIYWLCLWTLGLRSKVKTRTQPGFTHGYIPFEWKEGLLFNYYMVLKSCIQILLSNCTTVNCAILCISTKAHIFDFTFEVFTRFIIEKYAYNLLIIVIFIHSTNKKRLRHLIGILPHHRHLSFTFNLIFITTVTTIYVLIYWSISAFSLIQSWQLLYVYRGYCTKLAYY